MGIVAVDVSKEKLDVLLDDSNQYFVINNDDVDIKKLINKIKRKKQMRLVFEASGGYERKLRNLALKSGIPCSICQGKRIRDFARSQGKIAKTDKIDTKIIAEYAKKTDLQIINTRSLHTEQLRALNTRRRQILDLLNQEENKLEIKAEELITQSIYAVVNCLKEELEKLDQEIDKQFETHEDLKQKKEILETIPGLGVVSITTLVADLSELGTLSKSQITSLAGLAPMNRDSGKFSGKRKTGHSRGQTKSVLYMAALSAIRHNPKIKNFYTRLKQKGKPTKVALVACMRKLVVYANAMLAKNQPFKKDG